MLDRDQVMAILPHRPPFLFVDRIVEVEYGKRAVGEMDDPGNYYETVLRGHFPAYAVLPGAILVEALAEVGAVAALGLPANHGKIALLVGLDGWKFHRPARPGHRVRLEASLTRMRSNFGRGHAAATSDGELLAEGDLTFAIVDPPEELRGGS